MNRRAFTLVEVLIVTAIIGVIAAIGMPNFMTARKNAMLNTCKSNMRQIDSSIVRYSADSGSYPSDLAALSPDYIRTIPTCPLGGDYEYNSSTGAVTCPNASQGHTL